jgi:hypothetical protein
MIMPFPIPMNVSKSESQGVQLEPLRITKITMKPKYGTCTSFTEYDVIYIDATNDLFLIRDDDGDAVWVEFRECKIVK